MSILPAMVTIKPKRNKMIQPLKMDLYFERVVISVFICFGFNYITNVGGDISRMKRHFADNRLFEVDDAKWTASSKVRMNNFAFFANPFPILL